MKKEITVEEWLAIISTVLSQVALALKDDSKITLDEAIKLIILTLTEIVNAYNK